MTIEQWESFFGSGLRTDYDLTIDVASFGTDASYNNGQTWLLLLTGHDENDDVVSEMFSVGDKWESLDGGFTLSRPDGKGTINRNSNYGKFCQYAAEAIQKAGESWIFTANPFDSRIWLNTHWHFTEKVAMAAWHNRATNEDIPERKRAFPDTYLGRVADVPPSTPLIGLGSPPAPSNGLAGPIPPAAAPAAPQVSNSFDALSTLARSSATQSAFAAAAVQIESVAADDTLLRDVLDVTDQGFYARNHG